MVGTREVRQVAWIKKKRPLAQARTFDGGMVWELWWRGEVLFASTNRERVHEMALLINLGRRD
jgi:hypothetical protein